MLGLRFCVRAFSSCGERGPLFIAVHGPLTIAASLVAEHRLQTRRLSSCGSRPQLLCSMWDLPRPGLESVFPALAGRFSTTAPPGKPLMLFYYHFITYLEYSCFWLEIIFKNVLCLKWQIAADEPPPEGCNSFFSVHGKRTCDFDTLETLLLTASER